MALLRDMGVRDYCLFDPGIVRGLAYYTGIVFEIYDRADELRAICGGGRYDNLLRDFGGPAISATGMGMGDCVLEILLREKELLEEKLSRPKLDFFVAFADIDEETTEDAIKLTMELRSAGFAASFSYKAAKLGKQLKEASTQNAKKCIIIGDEFKDRKLVVKDMATGEQALVDYDTFLSGLDVG
jgi:histidyl-tRNA synthetase